MPRAGSHRALRLAALVQQELADILRREVKDPRVQSLLVTSVRLADDLRHARVYVRVPGEAEAREQTLRAVRHAARFVRRALGNRLNLHHVPELEFREDEALERGMRVYDLLQSLSGEQPDRSPDADDR